MPRSNKWRPLSKCHSDQSLFIRRGMVYSEGGQYDESLADYRQAQQLGPPLRVSFELGVLYYRMGEYQRASTYLDEYLERFPDYAPAYDYQARIARDAGDYDLALAHLRTYFRLQERPNPGNNASWKLDRATVLLQLGRLDDICPGTGRAGRAGRAAAQSCPPGPAATGG